MPPPLQRLRVLNGLGDRGAAAYLRNLRPIDS